MNIKPNNDGLEVKEIEERYIKISEGAFLSEDILVESKQMIDN